MINISIHILQEILGDDTWNFIYKVSNFNLINSKPFGFISNSGVRIINT